METVIGIAEISRRTGVSAPVLRSWERRYGFPEPVRLPNGRRGYHADDVKRIEETLRARQSGLSLAAAIRRVQVRTLESPSSVFAAVRHARPDAQALALPKRPLIALSHAIEDEYLARRGGGLAGGGFPRGEH